MDCGTAHDKRFSSRLCWLEAEKSHNVGHRVTSAAIGMKAGRGTCLRDGDALGLVRPSIISHVVEPSIVSHGLAHRYTNRQVEELQLWHGKFRAGAVLKPDNAGPLLKFLSNLVGQVLQTGNIQIAVSVSVALLHEKLGFLKALEIV